MYRHLVDEIRLLRAVPRWPRRFMLSLLSIQIAALCILTLSHVWVGRWIVDHRSSFPIGGLIFGNCILVIVFVAIDYLTRARSAEGQALPPDPFDIPLPVIKETLRVMPFGLAAFGTMLYGAISSGGEDLIPHQSGQPYQLTSHGSTETVSLARYIHVSQNGILFATGFCLLWLVLFCGLSRTPMLRFSPRLTGSRPAK